MFKIDKINMNNTEVKKMGKILPGKYKQKITGWYTNSFLVKKEFETKYNKCVQRDIFSILNKKCNKQ